MKLYDRDLESIINNEAREFAIYTVEERAIPNMIDGFKPVQRFIIYRALEKAKGDKNKFHKLAGLSGGVAEIGYHHGENAAAEAGKLMANTWNNNVPFLDGQGAFGSRLVQKGGAARYVFCRISKNFLDLYKDFKVCPVHDNVEHIPPAYYLPIIPTVLLNGVKGIATGYATSILPHSLKSVIECTRLALKGIYKEPTVEFPQFKGIVIPTDTGVELRGLYSLKGRTLTITEVPYKWERDSYIKNVLEKLVDDKLIDSEYIDNSGKDPKTGEIIFKFVIKLKKDFVLESDPDKRHEQILKAFGLTQKVAQFFTVIDEKGGIKDDNDFKSASDLIKHFVEVRKTFYDKRIEYKKKESLDKYNIALSRIEFIEKVLSNEIVISGRRKQDVLKDIRSHKTLQDHAESLISMNLYYITTEEVKKLQDVAKAAKKEHSYWLSTTAEVEYSKDLEAIDI